MLALLLALDLLWTRYARLNPGVFRYSPENLLRALLSYGVYEFGPCVTPVGPVSKGLGGVTVAH